MWMLMVAIVLITGHKGDNNNVFTAPKIVLFKKNKSATEKRFVVFGR